MNDTFPTFWCSLGGRVATATAAFATFGASLLALIGPSPYGTAIHSIVTLVCILGFLFAVGLATEHHGSAALTMILALPPLAGLFLAALPFVEASGPGPGIALLALAVAAMGRAAGLRAPAPRPALGELATHRG